MRKEDSLPSSCLDLPSPLKICGKPGEEVSPASVPESGEAVRLPMAGFPGRWLGVRCFLISPGEHGAGCQGPQAWRGGQRSETVGWGEAGLAWLLEVCGGAAVR